MKKQLIFASVAACALAVALAGCGSQAAPQAAEEASSAAAEPAAAATSEPATSPEVAPVATETSEPVETSEMVGMPNPWSEVATADEAATGAGIDGFSTPEGTEISLGPIDHVTYRCMEGLAEMDVEFPAVSMCIRKGVTPDETTAPAAGDVSGDYTEYANTWTQNVKGLELTCFGNREGDATKTIWTMGDMSYSITVMGLGGDTDYGLSADDLNSLVNAIQ